MKATTLLTATLLTLASAQPLANPPTKRQDSSSDTAIVLKIAPKSSSCDGSGSFADECATAAEATQPLLDSFSKYSISTPGEQAALLSLMAFESGDFKYVRNHFPEPGRPGQGCRNMMMVDFVAEFGKTLNVGDGSVPGADADKSTLLDNVIKAGGEWAAASWYYTSKCSDDVKTAVKEGSKAGWEKYITECVQTTVTDDRTAGWALAAQALGLSDSGDTTSNSTTPRNETGVNFAVGNSTATNTSSEGSAATSDSANAGAMVRLSREIAFSAVVGVFLWTFA